MRKLYLAIGLAALLVPVLDAAGCGGGDNPGSGGNGAGNSVGPAGGQVQDFTYSIKVTWTIAGLEPSSDVCTTYGVTDVAITLSGTEDPAAHAQKHGACAGGSVTFNSLHRLATGSAPFIEGTLVNSVGGSVGNAGVEVAATAGTVTVELPFLQSMASSTAGPGPGPGAGGGGMGGAGGAGGVGGAGPSGSGGAGPSGSSAMSSSSTGP